MMIRLNRKLFKTDKQAYLKKKYLYSELYSETVKMKTNCHEISGRNTYFCIMAYIISFDVWCAVFELTPDTSILSRRWSFRFPFSYTELLSDQSSKCSAIFKYCTVQFIQSILIKTKEAVKFD